MRSGQTLENFTSDDMGAAYELTGIHFARQFVETFGTHYVSQVTMGGEIRYLIESESCTAENEVSEALTASMEGKYTKTGKWSSENKSVGASGSADTSSTQSNSVEGSAMNCNAEVLGGDDTGCISGSCEDFDCDLMEELFQNLYAAEKAYRLENGFPPEKYTRGPVTQETQIENLKENYHRFGYAVAIAIEEEIQEHVRLFVSHADTTENTVDCGQHSDLGLGVISAARSSSSWSLTTMVFCAIFSFLFVVDACDSSGLQQCQNDYVAAVPGASGSQTCEVINTMRSCFNTKGAGCEVAALAQFNTMVDNAKKPTCEADGACVNHTLCTGAEGRLASGTPRT